MKAEVDLKLAMVGLYGMNILKVEYTSGTELTSKHFKLQNLFRTMCKSIKELIGYTKHKLWKHSIIMQQLKAIKKSQK